MTSVILLYSKLCVCVGVLVCWCVGVCVCVWIILVHGWKASPPRLQLFTSGGASSPSDLAPPKTPDVLVISLATLSDVPDV